MSTHVSTGGVVQSGAVAPYRCTCAHEWPAGATVQHVSVQQNPLFRWPLAAGAGRRRTSASTVTQFGRLMELWSLSIPCT